MIIKMKAEAGRDEIDYVTRRARSLGFGVHESLDGARVLLSLLGTRIRLSAFRRDQGSRLGPADQVLLSPGLPRLPQGEKRR